MTVQSNPFSNVPQDQTRSKYSRLLLISSLLLALSGCAGVTTDDVFGGRTNRDSYEDGVKKEAAKDYAGAIADFDQAIRRQTNLPEFILNTHKNNLAAGKPSDLIFLSDAYLHRANCKGLAGDMAGKKEDMALYAKQKVADDAVKAQIAAEKAANAAAASDQAKASASASKRNADARACLGSGYQNNCKETINVRGTGSGMCKGPVSWTIRPGRTPIAIGCTLTGISVSYD